jgi:hypothetical protein
MLKGFRADIDAARPESRKDAQRELWITVVISLGAFVLAPTIIGALTLPIPRLASIAVVPFIGSDIYISAVSLLSISIYGVSRAYYVSENRLFRFPHAASILTFGFMVVLISTAAYTAKIIISAGMTSMEWNEFVAASLGLLVFGCTCWVVYGVLVLRNDLDGAGAPYRMRQDQDGFVQQWLEDGDD